MKKINLDGLRDYFLQGYENGDINDPDFQITAAVNMPSFARNHRRAINALLAIVNDEPVRELLSKSNPRLLAQAVDAINPGVQGAY